MSSSVLVDVVVGDVTSVLHNDQDWMMRLFAVLKFEKIDLDLENIRVACWQCHVKISITVPSQQFENY